MPLMTPPHFNGVFYNGQRPSPAEPLVQVLEHDVDALQNDGWQLAGPQPTDVKHVEEDVDG